MISKGIILSAAVFLGVVYFVLSILAFRHITDEEKESKDHILLIMDPWWPFYSSLYTSAARKFCIIGKILFPIIVGLYIWCFVVAVC
jgi:hypothetical protein